MYSNARPVCSELHFNVHRPLQAPGTRELNRTVKPTTHVSGPAGVRYQQPGRSAERHLSPLTNPKPRLHGNRLGGAARAGSRAAVNGGDVTAPAPESLLLRRRRDRVGRERERAEKEEEEAEGIQGEVAAATAAGSSPGRCTDVLLRRLITCLSGISQWATGGMFTAAGATGRRAENGKILLRRCGRELQDVQIALEMQEES